MEEKTKVTVLIDSRQYTIIGTESSDYIKKVASYVNETITDILRANPALNSHKASVLAALNIADQLLKQQQTDGGKLADAVLIEELQGKTSRAEETIAALHKELNALKKENKQLKDGQSRGK